MAEENLNTGPIVLRDLLKIPEAYPRPDGYSSIGQPQETLRTLNIPGANGHIGSSEILARADHIHPLNYSKATPRPIGIPYGVAKAAESNKANFGFFGDIGIPYESNNNITNHLCNTYALSNHVHSYGFCEPTSITNSDKPYNLFPDGKKTAFQYLTLTSGGTVVPNWRGTSISDYSADKFGYSGVAAFPARLDHTHPLNCKELHDSSSTGNNVKNNIKPIGFDPSKSTSGYGASYGTDHYYARTDHIHPLPTNGIGATGIGSDITFYAIRYSQNNRVIQSANFTDYSQDSSKFNYGSSSYSQTWKRDSTSNNNGFVINVCCGVGNFGNTSTVGLVFRKLTFDKYGLCREVGTPVAIKLN